MQDFLRAESRLAPSYQDILQIYRARVVSKAPPGDDRLQVRIMPHMADIAETNALPYYPPFFKNQVIVARTEQAGANKVEFVWVAALPDFTVGFVLGLASSYETTTEKFTESYNYKSVIDGLIQRGIASGATSYENLYVQFWNDDYIEMIDTNSASAAKYFLLGNGTILALTANQIYMRVGTDDGVKSNFSAIRMSRDEINIVTDHFRVKAGTVTLGNKGLYVPGVMSLIPIPVKGGSLHPQTHIRL
jgi:hypothetical protein